MLHGWGAGPEFHWFPDEKKILENIGYHVEVPALPSIYFPHEKEWQKVIEDFQPGEETVIIGHSLGGTTALKFLEKDGVKIDKLFLVGTPIGFDLEKSKKLKLEELKNEIETDLFLELCGYKLDFDWKKIRNSANNFYLIYKDEDVLVSLDQGKELAKYLNAEIAVLKGRDHCQYIDLNLINDKLEKNLVKER